MSMQPPTPAARNPGLSAAASSWRCDAENQPGRVAEAGQCSPNRERPNAESAKKLSGRLTNSRHATARGIGIEPYYRNHSFEARLVSTAR